MSYLSMNFASFLEKINELFLDYLFGPVLKLLGFISPSLADALASSHAFFVIVWIVLLAAVIFLFNTIIILFQRRKGERHGDH